MIRNLVRVLLGIFMFGLYGCKIETPEIRGVVIDAETDQPVAEAWIFATLVIDTDTVQGQVTTYIALEEPHTRSNAQGEFLIPAREIKQRFSLFESRTRISKFNLGAETIDDKEGSLYLEDYQGKESVKVILYIKPWQLGLKDDRHYRAHVRSLYDYCLSGRLAVRVPPLKGGCDEWELNYAIAKHERFLNRLGGTNTIDRETYYAHTMRQLAFLCKMKGDYKKALDLYMKIPEFDRKRNVDLYLKRYEVEIEELQQILQNK